MERFHRTLLRYGIDDIAFAKVLGEEYLDSMPDQTALMPHAMEVLTELKNRGGIFAIVSNGLKRFNTGNFRIPVLPDSSKLL